VTSQSVSGTLYTIDFQLGETHCVKDTVKHEQLHLCEAKSGNYINIIVIHLQKLDHFYNTDFLVIIKTL